MNVLTFIKYVNIFKFDGIPLWDIYKWEAVISGV